MISDEAHRTQAGKLARNMRMALPNAAFIGFTGTPLFKHDQLTRRIFGDYVSRYDFKRSEADGATVKLVYENRGEKLGLAKLDLNDRVADAIDAVDLKPDQAALLEKLLGKDYEVITADERLDRIAADFVEHCSTRWEAGKAMLVCIDKITCARMLKLIGPKWKSKAVTVRAEADSRLAAIAVAANDEARHVLHAQRDRLLARAGWMDETVIELIISEAQNEVADFKRWGFDIILQRSVMKLGFETTDGLRVDVESAFKNPRHPFRIAVVCAMWLTGFDVECLATLYIDKPMRAHTLMQAIARANRVYPGKDFGLIVDYNGMLKSLREALAQYALGENGGEAEIVAPIEERVAALADAVEAVYTSDESRRRHEILARVVFNRFKALLVEPSALLYAERHDNIEAIYKKLGERRDTADVTELLRHLHRIVNQAIASQSAGIDQASGLTVDLSQINMEKLRDEFAKKVKHKATLIEDIRQIVEAKLAQMLARNPLRMNYEKKYQEIIAAYNQDKDRATVEDTFAKLIDLANSLNDEQRRALDEGLSEDQLALFDLVQRDDLSRVDRERIKQASKELLAGVLAVIAPLDHWTEKEQTQAEVDTFILDRVYQTLPEPPYTPDDKAQVAQSVYRHIWQQSVQEQFSY